MKTKAPIKKVNIVIDCADAGVMSGFYSKILNWQCTHPHANGWAAITSPTGMVIAFQEVENYTPPVWPWQEGKQGQMLHLDFYVDNLEEAVQFAVECGAKLANEQYYKTSRTMSTRQGTPFVLTPMNPNM